MMERPKDIDIIDYLYDTISTERRAEFEKFIEQNPEFAKEIKELQETQNILPAVPDEEVIPPLSATNSAVSNSKRLRSNWLLPISIAASLTLILITGYLTNFRMSFNQDGLNIGFSEPPSKTKVYLTEAEINDIVAKKVRFYSDQVNDRFTVLQSGLEQQLEKNQAISYDQLQKLARKSSKAELDDTQVLQFIAQLQDENLKMMQSFHKVSAEDQKTYIRNIMLEYSDFLEERRREDLQLIQANLLNLKNSSEVKQEETDKILANIITTVNNQNSTNNDRQSLD